MKPFATVSVALPRLASPTSRSVDPATVVSAPAMLLICCTTTESAMANGALIADPRMYIAAPFVSAPGPATVEPISDSRSVVGA